MKNINEIEIDIKDIIRSNDIYIQETGEWGFNRQGAVEQIVDYLKKNMLIKEIRKEKLIQINENEDVCINWTSTWK